VDHIVKPDLVAPGNLIASLAQPTSTLYGLSAGTGNQFPYSYYLYSGSSAVSTQYFRLSGTSMAAPMVAAAAALMIQKDPSLTPDVIKARLMKTATKNFPTTSSVIDPTTGITYTSQYDIFTVGAGYLDVWAALNSTDLLPAGTTAMSPTAVYDSNTQNAYVQNTAAQDSGSTAVWGATAAWGSRSVWGNAVFGYSPDSMVWGSSAVWGSRSSGGFQCIWGESAVWGSRSGTSFYAFSSLNGEN
jgi:serine protease AprX